MSLMRIRQWYDHWEGQVYVAFSGGKDSTVLLHLVRSLYPDVPAVFCDTGLEFPEVRAFVRSTPNVVWLKPKMNFRAVLDHYGYPVVSKRTAQYLAQALGTRSEALKRLRMEGIGPSGEARPKSVIPKKWKFLLNAPFKISDRCCYVMKKAPSAAYESQTGNKPFVGTMASEGDQRLQSYFREGCNSFNATRPRSAPLSFWLEEDIWAYLKSNNVPYSTIYDMGYPRTGCMFCMFGCHMEPSPNRFQRMKQTHPKLYTYCMDKIGLRDILAYMGVPYE